jgi:ABC-type transport system involved in multi-copper enzyme maturation permease subunit
MLLRLIRKELLNNILSFRFTVTYALLFVLVLVSVFLMGNEHRDRMAQYTKQEAGFRDRLEELASMTDSGEQFNAVRQEDFAGVRRPATLAVLARGLEGSLPTRVSSENRFIMRSSDDRLGRNILFEVFQAPDFAYVVNIVISLLALLFVFDSVCGEKERGTLKLLMSNSVPRDTVLLAKWIGGYLSIAAPFAVAVVAGYLYLSMSGAIELDGDDAIRFAAILGVSFLYISAFFSLGLMISTATHRAATALLMSLLVWIGWILVVPNLAPIVARLAAPVPPRQVIDAEQRAIEREAQSLQESIRKRKVYGDAEESERIQQESDQRQRKLETFYKDRMSSQVSLSQNLARLSPSASYLFAVTRLSGTGPALYAHFSAAVERFQEEHQEFERSAYNNGSITFTREGVQGVPDDWFDADAVPRLQVFHEGVSEALDGALFDILLLTVFNVLFFMLSYVFFLRYDVT